MAAVTLGYCVCVCVSVVRTVSFFSFFLVLCWVKWLFSYQFHGCFLSKLVIQSDPSESVSHF